MAVLKEGIEMNPRNFTRFVVLSKHGALPGLRNKSSLIFSVSDQPGALFETLRVFAEHNINLSKLESRPIHDRPWEYLFYVDVDADLSAAAESPLARTIKGQDGVLQISGKLSEGRRGADRGRSRRERRRYGLNR